MSTSVPVLALTFLGIIIAVLGLLGGSVELIVIGLAAIGLAGVLQVMGGRSTRT